MKIHILDVAKGKMVHSVSFPGCKSLKISGDGLVVFCIKDQTIQTWSISTGELTNTVEMDKQFYQNSFYLVGSKIWYEDENLSIEWWDLRVSGSPVKLPNISIERPHLNFEFSPLRITDVVTKNQIFQLYGKHAEVEVVQWNR